MEDGKINDGQKTHVLNDCKHTTESFESVINMQCRHYICISGLYSRLLGGCGLRYSSVELI